MALVERTNSSELYEMRLPYDTQTTTTRPRRSGSKKQHQKSILREKAAASPTSLSDDGTSISISTSSVSSSSRVSFVEDDISETRFYDTTAAARAVSSSTAIVIASRPDQPQQQQQLLESLPNNNNKNATAATLHYIQSKPSWMGDNTLSSTDVFHKRLNRPAVMIQAIVRGVIQRRKYRQERIIRLKQELYALEFYAVSMIQARVRGMQQRKQYALCRAAIPMQAAFRGWICRLELHVQKLHRRLEMVATRHAQELRQIENDKQCEMQRIYKDLHEVNAKGQRKQAEQRAEINRVIEELRSSNTKLRGQNETLHKATIIMAQKNERTMKLTQALYKNIREVESTLPQLQSDHDNISRVHRECKTVVQQYETALSTCQENLLGEKKISDLFRLGIENMLQKIENANSSTCSDQNKKLAETLRKSCSRRIHMALKEQEKSNQLARGKEVVLTPPSSTR